MNTITFCIDYQDQFRLGSERLQYDDFEIDVISDVTRFLSQPPVPTSITTPGVTQIERFTFNKIKTQIDRLD